MGAQPRQADGFRERRFGNLQRIQTRAKVQQHLRVEASADLAREHQVAAVEVADEQSTEPDPLALRVSETADDQLLARLAFHLEPVRRASMLVLRVAALGNHTFPPFGARALPGLVIVQRLDSSDRRTKVQRFQQCLTLFERQRGDVATVEPQDVEYVIRESPLTAPRAGGFPIEDDVVDTAVLHRIDHGRVGAFSGSLLRDNSRTSAAVLESQHADAVELALENPLGPVNRSCVRVAAMGTTQSGKVAFTRSIVLYDEHAMQANPTHAASQSWHSAAGGGRTTQP